jgi:signal transduction histidine kinase
MVPAFASRSADPHTRAWLVDGAVTAALLALFVFQLATNSLLAGQRPSGPLTYLLALAMVLPFGLHRGRPLVAAAIVLGALLAYALAHYGPYPGINAFVLLFAVALHNERRESRVVFAATLMVLTVAVWVQPGGVATASTWFSTLLLAGVAGLLGENLRDRRSRWAALQERARFVEKEREDRVARAVVEERLRIARDLHDVVAHAMSVIAVQSGVGHHVIDSQPDEARRALAAIESTSRAALTEMRRLLGVLRQEGAARAPLAPAPGLADLPLLVEQVSKAGLEVALRVTGEPTQASVPVDLTAYRIVQEALTNALKHGGPAARVAIDYGPSEVFVEVTDDGREGDIHEPMPTNGVGHGLIGMRERVSVFDGDLSACPQPGGGFRVAAHLPLPLVQS